ncbi:hypothetical protein [Nonomuraea sp. K271]|uniref:hypothetical protein n=1 Tax=Nonomuraea sp. K271 TaxID=1848319 RepID=UPI001378A209|nr:hypothetical protein [Nonomuraea sp. K271]
MFPHRFHRRAYSGSRSGRGGRRWRARRTARTRWFGGLADDGDDEVFSIAVPDGEWDKKTKLDFEREIPGLYVSDRTVPGTGRLLARNRDAASADLLDSGRHDRGDVQVAGLVTKVDRRANKAGNTGAILTVEGTDAATGCLFFRATTSCTDQSCGAGGQDGHARCEDADDHSAVGEGGGLDRPDDPGQDMVRCVHSCMSTKRRACTDKRGRCGSRTPYRHGLCQHACAGVPAPADQQALHARGVRTTSRIRVADFGNRHNPGLFS